MLKSDHSLINAYLFYSYSIDISPTKTFIFMNIFIRARMYVFPQVILQTRKFISNPDVEHHNSYASFKINGKDIDCFVALIAEKPFEKEGDSFFDCMTAALVPVDGTDEYYLPEDAENFWDVMGENTDYVIDPEECMADNFSFAMTYGMDGKKGEGYKTPRIIEEIIEYLSE